MLSKFLRPFASRSGSLRRFGLRSGSRRTGVFAGLLLGAVLVARLGVSQPHEAPRPNAAGAPHGFPPGAPGGPAHGVPPGGAPHGLAAGAPGHGVAGAHGGHGESGEAEHGGHAEHDEKAPPPPINWWHGLLGEKEGESSLWFRETGEPPPFLASLINFGVLVFIIVKFGKAPLAASLVKRKETIMREIDEAAKLRSAAEERLKQYEARMEKISDELDRVRRDFREQGERDKERIVTEAKLRRERMQKDAALLIEEESKQMRKDLIAEVVEEATKKATELLSRGMTLGDHDKFAEAFLVQLRSGGPRGGGAFSGTKGGSS